jgi:hypothetical protein
MNKSEKKKEYLSELEVAKYCNFDQYDNSECLKIISNRYINILITSIFL